MKRILYRSGIGLGTGLCALIFVGLNAGCQSTAPGSSAIHPINLVVAADGTGQFTNVQTAIMSVPTGTFTNPVIIHLKPGTYKELIYVQREKSFFRLLGEDPATTVITYDLYANLTNFDGKPLGTFHTPTATIDADDFTAENITFENSAGAVGQALAIRVDGDRAAFRNCRFLGWQDTILLNRGRQYFENCYIAGHVDFIFGAATAWFEKCHIQCLGDGYITAASTPADQPFGFVFSNCNITGDQPDARTYLGRPWRIHASTIFLNTEMSEVVRPEGWNDWKKPETHQTARYAEFNSTGPGANPGARAPWSRQLTTSEAKGITRKTVLGGSDGWNPRITGRSPVDFWPYQTALIPCSQPRECQIFKRICTKTMETKPENGLIF